MMFKVIKEFIISLFVALFIIWFIFAFSVVIDNYFEKRHFNKYQECLAHPFYIIDYCEKKYQMYEFKDFINIYPDKPSTVKNKCNWRCQLTWDCDSFLKDYPKIGFMKPGLEARSAPFTKQDIMELANKKIIGCYNDLEDKGISVNKYLKK